MGKAREMAERGSREEMEITMKKVMIVEDEELILQGIRNILDWEALGLDEFGKSLYTGSVDPEEYLPKLQEKLEATGIDKVIDEMQRQIDEWKTK